MKFIANILTDEPFSSDGIYNVVKENTLLVPGIPTLIIGWEKTKAEYPNASIIEWEVSDNVFWTYGKYEKRERYEENIKRFKELSIKKLLETVKYVFYDVILCGESKFNSFLAKLADSGKKTAYIFNEMLYICFSDDVVIGLSLRDCEYAFPDSKKKILSVIYSSNTVTLLKNNENIPRETRYRFKDNLFIIPYLSN